jgi:hypothetical protein
MSLKYPRNIISDLIGAEYNGNITETSIEDLEYQMGRCSNKRREAALKKRYIEHKTTTLIADELGLAVKTVSNGLNVELNRMRAYISYEGEHIFKDRHSNIEEIKKEIRNKGNKYDDYSIDDIGLSQKVCYTLVRNGIRRVGDINTISLNEILETKGIGIVKAEEIVDELLEYGFSIRGVIK